MGVSVGRGTSLARSAIDKLCRNHHRFNLLVSNKKFPTKVEQVGISEILQKISSFMMVPCPKTTNPLRFGFCGPGRISGSGGDPN